MRPFFLCILMSRITFIDITFDNDQIIAAAVKTNTWSFFSFLQQRVCRTVYEICLISSYHHDAMRRFSILLHAVASQFSITLQFLKFDFDFVHDKLLDFCSTQIMVTLRRTALLRMRVTLAFAWCQSIWCMGLFILFVTEMFLHVAQLFSLVFFIIFIATFIIWLKLCCKMDADSWKCNALRIRQMLISGSNQSNLRKSSHMLIHHTSYDNKHTRANAQCKKWWLWNILRQLKTSFVRMKSCPSHLRHIRNVFNRISKLKKRKWTNVRGTEKESLHSFQAI